MAKRDYYEVLGLSKGADEKEIKRAYKRLAMKYHPDRTKGDKESEEKFKEANEAYEVLSDPEKRKVYDQYGHQAFEQGGFGGGQGAGGFGGFGGFSQADFGDMFGDIFSEMFGGRGRGRAQGQPRARRGEDLRYDLDITLEEAATGVKKNITLRTWVECDHCHGTGAEKDSKVETCPTCHGMGTIHRQQGPFISEETCPTCHGTGKKIKKPCKECHGDGRVQKTETLAVTIPAGVDNGSRLRLAGKGAAGENGAPNGDLYIFIHVLPNATFERDGNDLHTVVDVSMSLAALGGSVEVPTLTGGPVKIKILAGTQTGKMLRLAGKGITPAHGIAGNLICHINVETPVDLTDEQKELLQKFADSLNLEKNSPKAVKFMK
ncbi:molecular chaperone DnaJ [Actinobacillus delphinicola]|uniref:Chaperone protein DnaJ n=1 Tax=Actinobacillus delphinicola TaxID=51161 RepID=A0A448TV41_9PAST|nr:molecular chaperone DnaJ [Actinobacillus delphinicola]VEJ09797.1 chaperone protein DnaJ [Actinobacillus delphinicola]